MTSHCQSIKTVWATIEPFSDVLSTVAVAQTCRGLHDEIIDADTQRIKVSHLAVSPPIFGDDSEDNKPWRRIPNYIPHLLNSIHWPSLRAIRLDFRIEILPRDADGNTIADATASCFPIFVSQLAYAKNLETLTLKLGGALHGDDDGNPESMQPLLELFGRNLSRCTKLKDVDITVSEHYCPRAMRGLLRGLTPVVVKQREVLSRVQLNVTSPGKLGVGGVLLETRGTLHYAAKEFFRNAISCPDLRVLEIYVPRCLTLTSALFCSAGSLVSSCSKRQKTQGVSSRLYRLCLHTYGMHGRGDPIAEERMVDARMLLELFSCCTELEDLTLGLHREVWRAHSDAVANILRGNKQKLSAVSFGFGDHRDGDGKMLELLRGCAIGNECKMGDILIDDLNFVDGQRLFNLLQDMRGVGFTVNDFIAVHNSLDSDDEVGHNTEEEDIPERVQIGRIWIHHDENYDRRERDLGPWY